MRVLESTRTLNDACEVKRQLLQQQAPLRFRLAVPPTSLADGTPLDSSTRVYAERPIISPYFHGQITHDRTRDNLQVNGLGIPTMPSQQRGPLVTREDMQTLSGLYAQPAEVNNTCGRFTVDSRFEVVEPTRAFFHVPHLPEYPASTRAEQRQHWFGCQANFVTDLKAHAPQLTAAMDAAPSMFAPNKPAVMNAKRGSKTQTS